MYSNQNDENQYGFYNTPGYKISKATKPYITKDDYVLPPQDRNTAAYNEQPSMRAPNIRKPIVTDIYDEDHYTLARNSGILTDHPPLDLDDDNDKNKSAIPKSNKKNGILNSNRLMMNFLIFGIFAIGAVCTYIVIKRQDKTRNPSIPCICLTMHTNIIHPTTASFHLTSIPKVDGSWGQWSNYGVCNTICGPRSKKFRSRSCDNPPPSNGGRRCIGYSRDYTTCPCPVDGRWGQWSEYGTCSKPCDTGKKIRTRVCDNPSPSNGGRRCFGSNRDEAKCNRNRCPGNSLCEFGSHFQIQECCSASNQCGEGQGDCDKDSECLGNLVCGRDNCDESKFPNDETDCCRKGNSVRPLGF